MVSPLKVFLYLILFIFFSNLSFSQGPGEPYNPETANGANGIATYNHILYWENPDSVVYNKIYFCEDITFVNSLDTSVILVNGYPNLLFFAAPLNLFGTLDYFAKYYWRVVEFTETDSIIGPIWYFRTIMHASMPILFF